MARKLLRSTPTITAGAYSAKDAIGQLMSVDRAARNGKGGVINSITILDKGEIAPDLAIYFFTDEVTAPADNAAQAYSDADLAAYLIGVIKWTTEDLTAELGGANVQAITTLRNLNLGFVLPPNKNKLWYQFANQGDTPTYIATTDLTLILDINAE